MHCVGEPLVCRYVCLCIRKIRSSLRVTPRASLNETGTWTGSRNWHFSARTTKSADASQLCVGICPYAAAFMCAIQHPTLGGALPPDPGLEPTTSWMSLRSYHSHGATQNVCVWQKYNKSPKAEVRFEVQRRSGWCSGWGQGKPVFLPSSTGFPQLFNFW